MAPQVFGRRLALDLEMIGGPSERQLRPPAQPSHLETEHYCPFQHMPRPEPAAAELEFGNASLAQMSKTIE